MESILKKILAKAREEVEAMGYQIGNIDCTLIAEGPRIGPHRDAMKAALSETLGIPLRRIGIKATSNEELDDLGQLLSMAAHAVMLPDHWPGQLPFPQVDPFLLTRTLDSLNGG